MQKDYYSILGVSKTANEQEIRIAYRILAKKWHPDKNRSVNASDKFRDISEAYEVLSNREKRRQYDTDWESARRRDSTVDDVHYGNEHSRESSHEYERLRRIIDEFHRLSKKTGTNSFTRKCSRVEINHISNLLYQFEQILNNLRHDGVYENSTINTLQDLLNDLQSIYDDVRMRDPQKKSYDRQRNAPGGYKFDDHHHSSYNSRTAYEYPYDLVKCTLCGFEQRRNFSPYCFSCGTLIDEQSRRSYSTNSKDSRQHSSQQETPFHRARHQYANEELEKETYYYDSDGNPIGRQDSDAGYEGKFDPSDLVNCPSCGRINEKASIYCTNCDAKLDEILNRHSEEKIQCPNCNTVVDKSYAYCPTCKMDLAFYFGY